MAKLITTLAEMQKMYADEEARREAKSRPKVKYHSGLVPNDKDWLKVWFLQELFADSKNYDEEMGHGIIAVEHKAGANFKRKALCTADEEGCVGCEQNEAGWRSNNDKEKNDPDRYKGEWGQTRRLYVNALVETKDGEKHVVVISQGDGPKSITPALFEHATDNGTIMGTEFKITRKGVGKEHTSYLLTAKGDAKDFDPKQYKDEVFDLSYVVRKVPYEEQHKFYGVEKEREESVQPELANANPESLQDIDW